MEMGYGVVFDLVLLFLAVSTVRPVVWFFLKISGHIRMYNIPGAYLRARSSDVEYYRILWFSSVIET